MHLIDWFFIKILIDPLQPTVGMLDMGGASMQIAYEVPSDTPTPDELTMRFNIGDKNAHKVYVTTFLSYGTHAASSR